MHSDPLDLRQDLSPPELSVGAYRFQPATGRLTCRSGAPLPLGRRATNLLAILAENAGRDVSATELLARVWPGQIVDPANVAVQISGLRAAIGDTDGSVIITVHGRGYRLATPRGGQSPAGNIPHALVELVGRDMELANAARLLLRQRLLVITGLAGTGKSRLACAAARSLAGQFPDGQWLVPLAEAGPLDADGLGARIACALELGPGMEPALLARAIGRRCCLLLLDGCELLSDSAIELIRRLLEACPQAAFLLTSHVAHRALREFCVRLSPLPLPSDQDDAAPAAAFFLEAARAAGLEVAPDKAAGNPLPDAVGTICRHMGGVPLGVEIAARAASLIGLQAAAAASRDPLHALPGTRRTGPGRHRSIGAAMDWSFGLLGPEERRTLRHLAMLSGAFSPQEAIAGVAQRWLGSLQEKSMIERADAASGLLCLNPLVRAYARNLPAGG